jgi:hypothetical protein
MESVNDTAYVAKLYRAQLHYRDLTLATAIAKASFEVAPDGSVVRVSDPLTIVESGQPTPYGELESDIVPIKAGCDFAIYGSAVSGARPVRELDVAIAVGAFERRLRVMGNRVWVATSDGFRASTPEPFTQIPLDYAHAFGGEALHDGDMVGPYHANPLGLGYVALKGKAAGTPLPNVEEVDQLLTSPLQKVMPAGILPLSRNSELRASRGVDVDLKEQRTSLRPTAFVWSHPRMHLPEYPALAPVRIRGMTSEPEFRFTLPFLAVNARIRLGEKEHVLPLLPDTLGIVPGHRRFWVVLRRAFVYQFLPERRRVVRFENATTATRESPTTSIAKERVAARPEVPIEPPDAPERMPLPFEMLRELYPLTTIIEALPLCASG